METFSALLARSPMNSPHNGHWRGALMFSFICAWINGWVNSREAGDLRRHRVHYDVTVMLLSTSPGKTMNLYWKGYLIVCETFENRTPPLLLALLLIMWYRFLPIWYFIHILSNIGWKCYISYQWNLLFTIVSLKYLDGPKSNAFVWKIIVPWLWTLLHILMILCWVGSE